MPIRPRSGRALAYRHRKSWSRSSVEGCLNENTWQPCGLMPDITCLIVPSLPAASIAWKMSRTDQRSWAYSMSCSSASQRVPRSRSSAAAPLSILSPRVSPGSKSFSRKPLPFVTTNGATNVRVCSRISFLGMASPCLSAARTLRPSRPDHVQLGPAAPHDLDADAEQDEGHQPRQHEHADLPAT